jgi:hypothetical protein
VTCERIVERTSYLLADGSTVGHYPISFACSREATTHISTPTHGGEAGADAETWINLCSDCYLTITGAK